MRNVYVVADNIFLPTWKNNFCKYGSSKNGVQLFASTIPVYLHNRFMPLFSLLKTNQELIPFPDSSE